MLISRLLEKRVAPLRRKTHFWTTDYKAIPAWLRFVQACW